MKLRMLYVMGAVLLSPSLVFARSPAQVSAGQIKLKTGAPVHFPNVNGSNLEGRKFNLPEDFEAKLNLVSIAFYGDQQSLVNTWLPTVSRLTRTYDTLKFYELPTLSKENGLSRAFIDGGMRAAIQDRATREVTITLYVDRMAFLKYIGETSDRTIYMLLVNRQGEILWRGQGAYTSAQEESLEKVLQPQL